MSAQRTEVTQEYSDNHLKRDTQPESKGEPNMESIAIHIPRSVAQFVPVRSFRTKVLIVALAAVLIASAPALSVQQASAEDPDELAKEELIAAGVGFATQAFVGTAVFGATGGNALAASVAGTVAGGLASLVTTALIVSLHDEIPHVSADVTSYPRAPYFERNNHKITDITQNPSFDPTVVVAHWFCPRCLDHGITPNEREQ